MIVFMDVSLLRYYKMLYEDGHYFDYNGFIEQPITKLYELLPDYDVVISPELSLYQNYVIRIFNDPKIFAKLFEIVYLYYIGLDLTIFISLDNDIANELLSTLLYDRYGIICKNISTQEELRSLYIDIFQEDNELSDYGYRNYDIDKEYAIKMGILDSIENKYRLDYEKYS